MPPEYVKDLMNQCVNDTHRWQLVFANPQYFLVFLDNKPTSIIWKPDWERMNDFGEPAPKQWQMEETFEGGAETMFGVLNLGVVHA